MLGVYSTPFNPTTLSSSVILPPLPSLIVVSFCFASGESVSTSRKTSTTFDIELEVYHFVVFSENHCQEPSSQGYQHL